MPTRTVVTREGLRVDLELQERAEAADQRRPRQERLVEVVAVDAVVLRKVFLPADVAADLDDVAQFQARADEDGAKVFHRSPHLALEGVLDDLCRTRRPTPARRQT